MNKVLISDVIEQGFTCGFTNKVVSVRMTGQLVIYYEACSRQAMLPPDYVITLAVHSSASSSLNWKIASLRRLSGYTNAHSEL